MAFTGKALYDPGVFDTVAEDVSDLISMISPDETPLLDYLGDADRAADNVLHEWLEDSLNPNTIVSSSVLTPAGTAAGVYVSGLSEVGRYYQVGAVFKVLRTGEFIQLSATNSNSISFTRAFAGTTAATIVAGDELFMISDASLEGADVTVDTSMPRVRKNNYCQIFKKDVIVSGTVQSVNHIGVGNEMEYQKTKKAREMLRDFEKAVIQGKLSGNTLGSATAYRTFKGLWDHITTNSTSLGTMTPDLLDTVVRNAWNNGGTDCDLIVCDANWKRLIDQFNNARVQTVQSESNFRRRITLYEGSFGTQQVLLSRWMPANTLMVLSKSRIKIMPLKGRSWQFVNVAKTGDSEKGMLIGEYTLELRNETGMAKAYG